MCVCSLDAYVEMLRREELKPHNCLADIER